MIGLYVTFLILGLAIFVIAIFGDFATDFATDFGHDFGGHDFDSNDAADHVDHPGLFSLRTMSALFAGFGVSGLCAKLLLGWGVGGQLFLGFATGFALAALSYGIMYAFYSQQSPEMSDSSELIGKSAVVTTGIGSQGIGECRVDNRHYTFREKNGLRLYPNEVGKVVKTEVGLLIVEKI